MGNTLDGELKVKAIEAAQVLRDLGAKQDAIDRFIGLKIAAKQAATAAVIDSS